MNKLVCTAMVAALAIGAHGMSVDWTLSGDKTMVGYTAYAILGSTAQDSWESLSAVQGAAIKVGGSGAFAGSRTVAAGATAKDDAITKESADIYFVIVNTEGSQFAVTAVSKMTGSVYDTENQETSGGAYSLAGTGLSYKDWGAGTGGGDDPGTGGGDDPGTGGGDDPGTGGGDDPGTGGGDDPGTGGGESGGVPEPTSGILLMIGGAALALRRR